MNETLTVNGITYEVLAADTIEAMEARGLTNMAAMFRAEGRTRQMMARRPKGRREVLIIEWLTAYGFGYRVVPMVAR